MAGPVGVLTVGVLGPLRVSVEGRPVVVTAGRLRTLLAVLAMSAGEAVSVDRLAAAVWGEELPDNARRSVQTYLTRLRRVLGAGLITTAPSGYLLRVDADQVDALRFDQLLDAAARAPEAATERALLAHALGLWRGAPFDGVRSAWLEHHEAPRLTERYLAAVERRIDLDLAQHRHQELAAHLYELTAHHPLRESLWLRLLIVLDRSGRQAEALERYDTIRRRLADELGTDPSPELQQAYADLLAGTPPRPASTTTPAGPADGQQPAPTAPVVPRQLPTDIDGFTGRHAALKTLDDLLDDSDPTAGPTAGPAAGPVVITAIAGTAGVGKTALAVHWAHHIAHRFPDGQLYVNLRGFHPSRQATTPAEALRGFLDALRATQIPTSLEAQIGLYRSLLAGKRILVLLDNARDADQVRPLLPGTPGCLVIVTSRNQLPGLTATEAAHPLTLDLLTLDEARQLLANRLGHDRIAAEPRATDDLITQCAHLPLALAIAAAHAAAHPTFPLHTLTTQLRDAQTRLTTLNTGDPTTDVRAVFSWSYHTLTPDTARLFRLLGHHPGPDTTTPAAVSLTGLPPHQVQALLAELTRAHLLTEHTPGRYTLHDLLRAYATELAHTHDPTTEHWIALHRLLDHYLHTAHTAARLIDPQRDPIGLAEPQPGTTPESFTDREQALAWFTAEHRVLLSSIDLASSGGFLSYTWQLAWTLADFLRWRGQWHDRAATLRTALAAAQRLGNRTEQARAHRGLGHVYTRLGRYDDALAHLQPALDLYGELEDPVGQARSHVALSYVLEGQGDHSAALDHARRALDLYPPTGHEADRARTLNVVGWCHTHLGDPQQGVIHCERALALMREMGDRSGEAATWDSLGYAHHHLGNHQRAITCYQNALDLRRRLGHRIGEANTLVRLGDTRRAAGDPDAARDAWQQALVHLEQLGEPDADQVRAKIHAANRLSSGAATPVKRVADSSHGPHRFWPTRV